MYDGKRRVSEVRCSRDTFEAFKTRFGGGQHAHYFSVTKKRLVTKDKDIERHRLWKFARLCWSLPLHRAEHLYFVDMAMTTRCRCYESSGNVFDASDRLKDAT